MGNNYNLIIFSANNRGFQKKESGGYICFESFAGLDIYRLGRGTDMGNDSRKGIKMKDITWEDVLYFYYKNIPANDEIGY